MLVRLRQSGVWKACSLFATRVEMIERMGRSSMSDPLDQTVISLRMQDRNRTRAPACTIPRLSVPPRWTMCCVLRVAEKSRRQLPLRRRVLHAVAFSLGSTTSMLEALSLRMRQISSNKMSGAAYLRGAQATSRPKTTFTRSTPFWSIFLDYRTVPVASTFSLPQTCRKVIL